MTNGVFCRSYSAKVEIGKYNFFIHTSSKRFILTNASHEFCSQSRKRCPWNPLGFQSWTIKDNIFTIFLDIFVIYRIFFLFASLVVTFLLFLFDLNHVYNDKPEKIQLASLAYPFSWFGPSFGNILATALERGDQPGRQLEGRQNHVSSSTAKYGFGLNFVKLTFFVKKSSASQFLTQ